MAGVMLSGPVLGAAVAAALGVSLPAPGRLLVEVPASGAAIVEPGGRVLRLGRFYDTAWSPDGRLVAGVHGHTVTVVDGSGTVRWRLRESATSPPAQPAWSPDGRRLAYRTGRTLRIVGADGQGERVAARGLQFTGPSWRPGPVREVAWAGRHGRVHLRDLRRNRRWTSPTGPPVRPGGLQWSGDGRRLAAISGSAVRVFSARTGALIRRITTTRLDHFQTATYAGGRLVLVRHDFSRGTSRVTTIAGNRPSAPERTLLRGRGSVSDVTASPDGRWLLLGRPYRDRWEFRSLAPGGAVRRIDRVIPRITGRRVGAWAFPAVRAWRP